MFKVPDIYFVLLLAFSLTLALPYAGYCQQPIPASEQALPDLYTLSSSRILAVRDSLVALQPPPSALIEEVELFLESRVLDEAGMLTLIDSLLDKEGLSPFIMHQIQQDFRLRETRDPEFLQLPTDSVPPKPNISFSSVEIRPGLDFTAMELRMLGQVTPWFYFYSWNRIRATYEGQAADNFNIVDLYFRPFGNFFLVQETQFFNLDPDGIVLRGGAQYLQRFKNGAFLILSTVNTKDIRDFEVLTQLRYFPPLSKTWSGVLFAESLTIYNKDGHVGSAERVRLGVMNGDTQFGGACDFQQIGTQLEEQNIIPSLFLIRFF